MAPDGLFPDAKGGSDVVGSCCLFTAAGLPGASVRLVAGSWLGRSLDDQPSVSVDLGRVGTRSMDRPSKDEFSGADVFGKKVADEREAWPRGSCESLMGMRM